MRTRPHTLERDKLAPNMEGAEDGDTPAGSSEDPEEDAGVFTSFMVSVDSPCWTEFSMNLSVKELNEYLQLID